MYGVVSLLISRFPASMAVNCVLLFFLRICPAAVIVALKVTPLLNICVCVNVFAALVFAESFSEFLSSARSDAFAIPDTAGTVTDVPVIGSVIVMSPLPVRAVDHPCTTLRQRVNALASWFAKDDVLAVSDVIIPYFAPEKAVVMFLVRVS